MRNFSSPALEYSHGLTSTWVIRSGWRQGLPGFLFLEFFPVFTELLVWFRNLCSCEPAKPFTAIEWEWWTIQINLPRLTLQLSENKGASFCSLEGFQPAQPSKCDIKIQHLFPWHSYAERPNVTFALKTIHHCRCISQSIYDLAGLFIFHAKFSSLDHLFFDFVFSIIDNL